ILDMPAIAAQMGDDPLRACAFADSCRNDGIWLRVLGFRHRGIPRLAQRCYVIDVDSQAQTAHVARKIRLIAPNRTQSKSLSKWEKNRRRRNGECTSRACGTKRGSRRLADSSIR